MLPNQDKTECNQVSFEFLGLISRKVHVESAENFITSDAGSLILGQLERNNRVVDEFAKCFTDYRKTEFVEHRLDVLLRQRVFGIALGYEDLNDHEKLRLDPLIATICARDDVEGNERVQSIDKGKPLAGKSTLNRLELSAQEVVGAKKIESNPEAIENFFIKQFVKSLPRKTQRVVLDLDTTDDRIHGMQEGRFFHGYYDDYCYCPLYVFCGDFPVVSKLRTADQDHIEDTAAVMTKVAKAIRKRFKNKIQIIWRGDSAFGKSELVRCCHEMGADFVFGFGSNKVLKKEVSDTEETVKSIFNYNKSEEKEKLYKEFKYKPETKAWKDLPKLRTIGKCEYSDQGMNTRFIITNLSLESYSPQELYEELYCGRGDMENRIKEQKLDLKCDRTSTHYLKSNQLRLWFTTLAYLMIHQLRDLVLEGTQWARATCQRIRLDLFKIGASIKTSCRRIIISFSEGYPHRATWNLIALRLGALQR